MLNAKVLLLNQNYEPLTVVSARKAIVLEFAEKVEVVERRERWVHSQHLRYPVPSIVRLRRFIHIPHKRVELTRRNIMRRDGFRCQYCNSSKGPFTIDHVLPKTRGGADTWENLVCACVECNSRKGSRTPEQANLRIAKQPRRPSHLFFIQHFIGIQEEGWKPYLFMN